MRTLLVGDVHGCSRSLAALLKEARPDRLILLGDIFAKGPDPLGVWALIKKYRAEAVLGNHDAKMLKVWDQTGESTHHQAAHLLGAEGRAWVAALPLFLHGQDWVAVHGGLHPTGGVAATTREMALILRRWPDDRDTENPFWWQIYTGKTRVFYGHDAVRGLQIHTRTLGLDAGCMYGNALAGYLLEENRVIQVDNQEGKGI